MDNFLKKGGLLFLAACGAVAIALAILHSRRADSVPPPVAASDDEIDKIVQDALKAWQVPGVAVAIVRDDRVIYLKGFGVRDSADKDAVTPDTLFPLASCTKAFTTTAMAMLVDEKKLGWDDPVRKHVPRFHLADPLADAQVMLRDLVTHRTGLASNDFLWYRSPWSRDEVVRRIGLVKPKHPFRGAFEYQSTMFTVAGMAVESASGRKWEEFVRARICEPLGMKHVAFTTPEAHQNPDHARPHRLSAEGKVVAIPEFVLKEPEPAGSMHASARDLAEWVRFQLGDGTFAGKPLVSKESLEETHSPQFVIPLKGQARDQNPDTFQMSYGMAWVVQDYQGRLLVSHAGQVDGFRAHITLVPRDRLGIVLLNNLDRTYMNLAISNAIVDRLLELPRRDWNAFLRAERKKAADDARARYQDWLSTRKVGTSPSAPLEKFVGAYSDPAYDTARITLENGRLIWKWSTFSSPLTHFHLDTFVLENEILGFPRVEFSVKDGVVASMKVSHPLEVEFKR
jgi:CubicO group peptidase (beta-lactamase class C family)